MSNVIQISKSQGFTRMDNTVYEALIGANLSRRDMKAVLVIHRLTAGYNKATARVAAVIISDMAQIHRTEASRAISSLLEQRVIYRVGGSRGPVGICPVSEWNIGNSHSVGIPSQCEKVRTLTVRDSSHNKDSKDNTSSNEEVINTREPEAAQPLLKAKTPRKQPFGITEMLANNPHGLSETTLNDYLALRKAKRAPMTAKVWKSLNDELAKCAAANITSSAAMDEALLNGWQGFKSDWIVKRLGGGNQAITRHTGFDQRDYTVGLGEQREDGSYEI